jgi:hypothetical protein
MSGGGSWQRRSIKFSAQSELFSRLVKEPSVEIHIDPPFGTLLACSLPFLLLLLLVAAVLTTRSKLNDAAQMKKNLRDGVYDRYFSDPKKRLAFRIIGGVGLVYGFVLLGAISLLMYSVGKAVGFDNWVYWFVIVIPFIASLIGGGLVFFFYLKKKIKENKRSSTHDHLQPPL